jgi:hypothetical protein
MFISTEFWVIGLNLGELVHAKGLLTVNKILAIVRGRLASETQIEFPAGGQPDDQLPLINLVLRDVPFTERLDMYFDIGATDSSRDLDVISDSTMPTIYLDPAYAVGEGHETAGTLPPKAVLLRCLIGSGLVYVNAGGSVGGKTKYNAPFSLHAESGFFYYAFPRGSAHAAKGGSHRISLHLASIHLRTFEAANRFQLIIFR